ncbi:MAG: hypothetical protein JJ992_13165, partial [Planctomycetes bacterium]|nr:hypothetical protein [Planctomycetota bacterium]
ARTAVGRPPRMEPKPAAIKASAPDRGPAAWVEPDWSALVTRIGVGGAVRLLASNCAYLKRDGNTIYLGLDPRSESLLTKRRKEDLAHKLSEHFGETLQVDIALHADGGETPVQAETRLADERMEAARQSLEADPNVQALKNMFGAELKAETIELIDGPRGEQRNN